MTPSPTMQARLNEQITHELLASQTYLSMSCSFDATGLKRLAEWFRRQSDEERRHALRIVDYLLRVGARVVLQAVPQPPADFPSVPAALEAALQHEHRVTQQIEELVSLAEQERDHATRNFLEWFVAEQVEEVSSATHLVQLARLAGSNLLQLEALVSRAQES